MVILVGIAVFFILLGAMCAWSAYKKDDSWILW